LFTPQILNQKVDEGKLNLSGMQEQSVCQIDRDRSKSRDEIEFEAAIKYKKDMEKF